VMVVSDIGWVPSYGFLIQAPGLCRERVRFMNSLSLEWYGMIYTLEISQSEFYIYACMVPCK
jgi:hypothetical protein